MIARELGAAGFAIGVIQLRIHSPFLFFGMLASVMTTIASSRCSGGSSNFAILA